MRSRLYDARARDVAAGGRDCGLERRATATVPICGCCGLYGNCERFRSLGPSATAATAGRATAPGRAGAAARGGSASPAPHCTPRIAQHGLPSQQSPLAPPLHGPRRPPSRRRWTNTTRSTIPSTPTCMRSPRRPACSARADFVAVNRPVPP